MERIVEREGLKMPAELKLERYISPNFMGFFLREDSAAALKSMASQFCRELADLSKSISNSFPGGNTLISFIYF